MKIMLLVISMLCLSAQTMEKKDLKRSLSDYILGFSENTDDTIETVLKSWREEYVDFIQNKIRDKKLDKQDLQNFFSPYVKEIYNVYNEKGCQAKRQKLTPTVICYDLVFYKYEKKILIQYHRDEICFFKDANGQADFKTIGRQDANDIFYKGFPLDLSRLHLIILPIPDGRILIIDPFSLGGTEQVDLENLEYGQVALRQDKRANEPILLEKNALNLRIGASVLRFIPRADDRIEEARACAICLENFPDCKFRCGHACVCFTCKAKTKDCPLCRKLISTSEFAENNYTFYDPQK